jgi:hypothetical protein
MRMPPAPRPKGSKGSTKPRGRKFRLVVDLGDGKPRECWVMVDRQGFAVRAVRGRSTWWLPLGQAAEVVARRAQVRAAEMRMGTGVAD